MRREWPLCMKISLIWFRFVTGSKCTEIYRVYLHPEFKDFVGVKDHVHVAFELNKHREIWFWMLNIFRSNYFPLLTHCFYENKIVQTKAYPQLTWFYKMSNINFNTMPAKPGALKKIKIESKRDLLPSKSWCFVQIQDLLSFCPLCQEFWHFTLSGVLTGISCTNENWCCFASDSFLISGM